MRQGVFVTASQDALRFNLDPDGTLPDGVIVDELMKTRGWSKFEGITCMEYYLGAANCPAERGHILAERGDRIHDAGHHQSGTLPARVTPS